MCKSQRKNKGVPKTGGFSCYNQGGSQGPAGQLNIKTPANCIILKASAKWFLNDCEWPKTGKKWWKPECEVGSSVGQRQELVVKGTWGWCVSLGYAFWELGPLVFRRNIFHLTWSRFPFFSGQHPGFHQPRAHALFLLSSLCTRSMLTQRHWVWP